MQRCDMPPAARSCRVQRCQYMGGLLPLVNMLTSNQLPAPRREAAARATFDSSTRTEMLHRLFAAAGAVQLLEDQLSNSSSECQQNAALAIYCICNGRPMLCQQMVQTGILDHLMVLLSSSGTACQERALLAVSCICNQDPQSVQLQRLDSRNMQLSEQLMSHQLAGVSLRQMQ